MNESDSQFSTIKFYSTTDSNFNKKILYFMFQNETLIDKWQNYFDS